jgi:hypothetical protein
MLTSKMAEIAPKGSVSLNLVSIYPLPEQIQALQAD